MLRSTRMPETGTSPSVYRFGSFELDLRTGELRKRGVRTRLQGQPLRILVLLLDGRGELVSREQIQEKLWPPGTYVDYDNAINSAVRKLREALSDTAENPRFIETCARRGYRFIGSLDAPAATSEPMPPVPQELTLATGGWRFRHIAFGALLLFAIATVVVWRAPHSHSGSSPVPISPVPLTAAPGWESEPAFSPDGTQIAYVWDEGAGRRLHRHIFVKLIGGGTPLRLTSSPNQDRSPAWSPDGRSIAFVRVSKSSSGIYAMPALGGAERRIAEGYFAMDDLFPRTIAWSPDGRFLAVAEAKSLGGSTFVSLVNIETGDRVPLKIPRNSNASDINPAFAPDGRTLLFTRCEAKCGLYVVKLGTDYRAAGKPVSLAQEGQEIEGSAWKASGTDVVYSLYKADWDGYIMKVRAEAGARPERLTFKGEVPFSPFSLSISPRGNRLAYAALLYFVQIWQVESGKPPRSFSPSTRLDFSPQFSPDGKRVAFASNRSDVVQIWTCNADGGDPTPVTHFDSGISGTPRWSPDGRSIAFDRRTKNGWGIFVTAYDGGNVRKLTSEEKMETIPSWSADGSWIYYVRPNQSI